MVYIYTKEGLEYIKQDLFRNYSSFRVINSKEGGAIFQGKNMEKNAFLHRVVLAFEFYFEQTWMIVSTPIKLVKLQYH